MADNINSNLPLNVSNRIDSWFQQRSHAMLSGLDDLWKEKVIESMDSALRYASMSHVIKGLLFINKGMKIAWHVIVSPALDKAWKDAVMNSNLLNHQDEIKSLIEEETKQLRKQAYAEAEKKWNSLRREKRVEGDFTQKLIHDLFEADYIDTSVPTAHKIDEKEVRREFKQIIRLAWLRDRHNSKLNKKFNDSEKRLYWSLLREVIDRTAHNPAKIRRAWMIGDTYGGVQLRFKDTMVRFYNDRSYLAAAFVASRILFIQYQGPNGWDERRTIHWSGHSFSIHKVPSVSYGEREIRELARKTKRLTP